MPGRGVRVAGNRRRLRIEICPSSPAPDAELPRALCAIVQDTEFAWQEPGAAVRGDAVIVACPSPDAVLFEPDVRDTLCAFARSGGAVLGVGAGVALLCEAGLLPGGVTLAAAGPERVPGHIRVEGRATPFTWAIPAGRILAVEEPTPRLRYAAPAAEVAALEARGGLLLRYCDAAGGATEAPDDPAASVAALCDEGGRIVGVLGGLWPLTDGLTQSLGRQIIASLRLF